MSIFPVSTQNSIDQLALYELTLSPSGRANYRSVTRQYLAYGKGDYTQNDILAYLAYLSEKGLRLGSIKVHKTFLTQAGQHMGRVYNQSLFRSAVKAFARLEQTKAVAYSGKRNLTKAMIAQLIELNQDNRYGRLYRLHYITGMRAREMLALTPEQVTWQGTCWVLTLPMTKSGKAQEVIVHDHALLSGFDFKMPCYRVYLRKLKRDLAKLGHDPACFATHSFRSANAVEAYHLGVSIDRIQDKLRHADPRTTRSYLKTIDLQQRDYSDQL